MGLLPMDCKVKAVLTVALCLPALAGCGRGSLSGRTAAPHKPAPPAVTTATQIPRDTAYGAPAVLAHIEDRSVDESSGIVASRLMPGVFWTHNDSGGGPYVYAFDRRGRRRGVWRVTGAASLDWEDIAAGPGPEPGRPYLYVGDIGNNEGTRDRVTVYRFPEPAITAGDADRPDPGRTEAAEAVTLRYPDGRYDAETLLVHPRTGDVYVITKPGFAAAGVYKLRAPREFSGGYMLRRVGSVAAPGIFAGAFTGGDISPDGARVVFCDYVGGYELELPEGLADADFDRVWAQPLTPVTLGPRRQGEAVCYSHDGSSVLSTSEMRPAPLIEVVRAAE